MLTGDLVLPVYAMPSIAPMIVLHSCPLHLCPLHWPLPPVCPVCTAGPCRPPPPPKGPVPGGSNVAPSSCEAALCSGQALCSTIGGGTGLRPLCGTPGGGGMQYSWGGDIKTFEP